MFGFLVGCITLERDRFRRFLCLSLGPLGVFCCEIVFGALLLGARLSFRPAESGSGSCVCLQGWLEVEAAQSITSFLLIYSLMLFTSKSNLRSRSWLIVLIHLLSRSTTNALGLYSVGLKDTVLSDGYSPSSSLALV